MRGTARPEAEWNPRSVQASAEPIRTRMTELPRLYGLTARIHAERELVFTFRSFSGAFADEVCGFRERSCQRMTSSACRGMRRPSGSWMLNTPSLSTGAPFLLRRMPARAFRRAAFSTRRLRRLSVDFELLLDDGLAVGRDLVAQHHARRGFALVPRAPAGRCSCRRSESAGKEAGRS